MLLVDGFFHGFDGDASVDAGTVEPMAGNTRKTGAEQYYTPASLASSLVDMVLPHLSRDPQNMCWVEPAGGTGAFCDVFATRGWQLSAVDIEPKHGSVRKANFLSTPLPEGPLAVVSNPPFGRCNSLSVPFFNHAASVNTDVIAFIVPKSWRKWSVINRLHPNFWCVHDHDLNVGYVGDDGSPLSTSSSLNTVFQVWQRRDVSREKIVIPDLGYVMKTKNPTDADVALTVFGRGCGTVRTVFEDEPKTTQMYLKLNADRFDQVLDALNTVDFSRFFTNVAYTEALSLVEINALLNEAIPAQS